MTSENTPRTSFDIAMKHGNWNNLRDASAAWDELLDYTVERERELAALKRGEFICQKCSLRKDGEHDTPIEF